MSSPVLIASLLREQGDTGVQTHVRVARDAFLRAGRSVQVVTPFSAPQWQVYPVFGIRRLIDRLRKPASVWWYRQWHAVFLGQALRRALADGAPCVVYAQCPLSARAALRARRSARQAVVMAVHFNLSQASEWAEKGAISPHGAYFRAMQALEAATLPRVDALVHVSAFMRGALERRIPALQEVPTAVIPNFVDDPGAPAEVEPHTDLVTIGTLEQRKNQRYALDILAAANAQGRRLTLTVLGDGPDRAALEAQSRRLILDWAAGVSRFYWYAWDHDRLGFERPDGTMQRSALRAYAQMQDWLLGSIVHRCDRTGELWTCAITLRSGARASVVWTQDNSQVVMPVAHGSSVTQLDGSVSVAPSEGVLVVGAPTLVEVRR